jgi:hypothetical protein
MSHSAIQYEDKAGCALPGLLATLSLGDSHTTVESEPSRFNPFEFSPDRGEIRSVFCWKESEIPAEDFGSSNKVNNGRSG